MGSLFLPGVIALWGALLAGLASAVLYFGVERGRTQLLGPARSAYNAFATCIVAAAAVLMTLLLQHRFDVAYVNSYSSRDLPLHFLVSTFWAGQEGSFLLWLLCGALIGFFVYRSAKEQEAPVMIVYLSTFLVLVAILCKQSPFKMLPPPTPADGGGLNPLLQDPWMVIHPPVMFAGFASLSVPFAFAIGALWKKRWDGWAVRAIPWALFSFLTLGTAILMGGYWAYKTLGWGGYWGWDPVENTSLVPWLCTTALVHGLFLQRARKRHRKVNLILACVAFLTILYGTFLTRSGILADFSVHSFVDLGITGWLVGILGGFLLLSAFMLTWRWRSVPAEEEGTAALSRSVLFILGIAVLCALSFVILLGTSAPLLTRLTGNPSQVQNSFYLRTTVPGAILLALLAALVPFVSWKGETAGRLLAACRRSFIVAAASLGIGLAFGARDALTLVMLFLAGFAGDMNLRIVMSRARKRAFGGTGGYLAHVGLAIMLAGIVVSGVYAKSERVNLITNQPRKVAGSTLTFLRVVPGTAARKQSMEVRHETPQGKVFYEYPKMYTNSRTGQMMVNPAIRHSAVKDFYIAPQAYDPGQAEQVGRVVRLARGTTQSIEGVGFSFRDFEVDRAAMARGEKTIAVLAGMTVTPPDGSTHEVTLRYDVSVEGVPVGEPPVAEIPGVSGAQMRVAAISPNEDAVAIWMRGLSKDGSGEYQAATKESLSVDVTSKPLINLVWGGFYVMMAGALIAFLQRSKESRRAEVTEVASARPALETIAPPTAGLVRTRAPV